MIDRFLDKFIPEPNSGCWLWTGATTTNGYGRFHSESGQNIAAHRYSFEKLRGNIPEGLEIDHLCKVRSCVNPDHMETVTHRENLMRSENIVSINSKKTECKNGHSFDLENTGHDKKGRYCRKCAKLRTRAWRRRKANG